MFFKLTRTGFEPSRTIYVVDPDNLMEECKRYGWDTSEWEGKANSFVWRMAPEASYGYFLICGGDANSLLRKDDGDSLKLDLYIEHDDLDENGMKKSTTIKNLHVLQLQNVTPHVDAHKAVYLLMVVNDLQWMVEEVNGVPTRAYENKLDCDYINKIVRFLTPQQLQDEGFWDETLDKGKFQYVTESCLNSRGNVTDQRAGPIGSSIPKKRFAAPLDWLETIERILAVKLGGWDFSFPDAYAPNSNEAFNAWIDLDSNSLNFDFIDDVPEFAPSDVNIKTRKDAKRALENILIFLNAQLIYKGEGKFLIQLVIDSHNKGDVDQGSINDSNFDYLQYETQFDIYLDQYINDNLNTLQPSVADDVKFIPVQQSSCGPPQWMNWFSRVIEEEYIDGPTALNSTLAKALFEKAAKNEYKFTDNEVVHEGCGFLFCSPTFGIKDNQNNFFAFKNYFNPPPIIPVIEKAYTFDLPVAYSTYRGIYYQEQNLVDPKESVETIARWLDKQFLFPGAEGGYFYSYPKKSYNFMGFRDILGLCEDLEYYLAERISWYYLGKHASGTLVENIVEKDWKSLEPALDDYEEKTYITLRTTGEDEDEYYVVAGDLPIDQMTQDKVKPEIADEDKERYNFDEDEQRYLNYDDTRHDDLKKKWTYDHMGNISAKLRGYDNYSKTKGQVFINKGKEGLGWGESIEGAGAGVIRFQLLEDLVRGQGYAEAQRVNANNDAIDADGNVIPEVTDFDTWLANTKYNEGDIVRAPADDPIGSEYETGDLIASTSSNERTSNGEFNSDEAQHWSAHELPTASIIVTDPDSKFYGYALYEDPQFGEQDGYRGTAYQLSEDDGGEDYAGTGLPGYQIINMESPARWIEGFVIENTQEIETINEVPIWKPREKVVIGTLRKVPATNPLIPQPFSSGQIIKSLKTRTTEPFWDTGDPNTNDDNDSIGDYVPGNWEIVNEEDSPEVDVATYEMAVKKYWGAYPNNRLPKVEAKTITVYNEEIGEDEEEEVLFIKVYDRLSTYLPKDNDKIRALYDDEAEIYVVCDKNSTVEAGVAMIFGEVPPTAGYGSDADEISPGYAGGICRVISLRYTEASGSGGIGAGQTSPGTWKYEVSPNTIGCINPSHTTFRGSPGFPIIVGGNIITVGNGQVFQISQFDLASLPGYATGQPGPTADGDDPDLQIPFHPGGDYEFTLDSKECSQA